MDGGPFFFCSLFYTLYHIFWRHISVAMTPPCNIIIIIIIIISSSVAASSASSSDSSVAGASAEQCGAWICFYIYTQRITIIIIINSKSFHPNFSLARMFHRTNQIIICMFDVKLCSLSSIRSHVLFATSHIACR